MAKMLRIPPVKSLISLAQIQSVRCSSGLTKEQLLRLRAEQKQLYGRIIRGDTEQCTESVKKAEEEESIASVTADFKISKPSNMSEFYWLIQRGDSKNVKIFRSKEVKIGKDISTKDRFNASTSNKTS